MPIPKIDIQSIFGPGFQENGQFMVINLQQH